jgi:hypothetical protein
MDVRGPSASLHSADCSRALQSTVSKYKKRTQEVNTALVQACWPDFLYRARIISIRSQLSSPLIQNFQKPHNSNNKEPRFDHQHLQMTSAP